MAIEGLPKSAAGERQKFYFQFITTPTVDTTGTTLLLHFNSQRYIFGRVAEGTQRAIAQRGVGIKKVRNIFLTGPTTWQNMGGLIGMILTMADVQHDELDPTTGKRPQMSIQGGPKLMHAMACARRFVFRTGMPLEIREANPRSTDLQKPAFMDENIDVWSLPVMRRGRSGTNSPRLPNGRSQSPATLEREQTTRKDAVKNMFDSDWRKDRLVESRFDEVSLPALIWTRNPDTQALECMQCATMEDAPDLRPDSTVLVRDPWPASLIDELPPADNVAGSVAVSYVVRGKAQRGRFRPEKAKELGVKAGPNYALLAAGGSVTLDDGTIITSDMVLDAIEPGRGMAIFDIPTEDYLEDLSEKVETLLTGALNGVETVSWILGENVLVNPTFATLVDMLPGRHHIVSSPDTSPNYIAFDSSAASSVRLRLIRPACYKTPVHNNEEPSTRAALSPLHCIPAERGLIVEVAPKYSLSRTDVTPFLNIEETEASSRDALKHLLPESDTAHETPYPYDDIEILTLGTGSALPSKYRNVSATLVRIPHLGSYLFDCGENTLGQLQRAFTPEEFNEVLVDLRMIWISHLHADHHLGTLSVIEAKKNLMGQLGRSEPKLYLASEPNMADFLNDYTSIQSSSHCELLGIMDSEIVTKNSSSPSSGIEISQTSLPITEFLTTKVSHCHGAQACSITFSNGFKFSYSGDCRPSKRFAEIGLNSDVLLHEATFDDGLEDDAMEKKHSTTGEALAVAYAMRAKNVVLTHFSQRYQKIPVLDNAKVGDVRFEEGNDSEENGPIEEATTTQAVDELPNDPKDVSATSSSASTSDAVAQIQKVAREMHVCVAFDLMSVKLGQIRDMYKYYPAIEKMFELQHEKSEAMREQRREQNEQTREPKKVKTDQQNGSPGKNKNTSLYERINRNKKDSSRLANNSTTQSSLDAPQQSNPKGDSHTAGEPSAPMSNKARRRQKLEEKTAQTISESDNGTQTNRSTRSRGVDLNGRDKKRLKLDEGLV